MFDDAVSLLEVLARASGQFLFAAVALSFVAALIANGVEGLLRPWGQRSAVGNWALHAPVVRRIVSPPGPPGAQATKDPVVRYLRDLPGDIFALTPDQLCAQIARDLEFREEEKPSPAPAAPTAEASSFEEPKTVSADGPTTASADDPESLLNLDRALDALQSRLQRDLSIRAYSVSFLATVALCLLLYAALWNQPIPRYAPEPDPAFGSFSPPVSGKALPDLPEQRSAPMELLLPLSVMFGLVGALLAPVLQAPLSRLARWR